MATRVPAPIRHPVIDAHGRMTPEWLGYVQQLGSGSDGGTIDATQLVGLVPLASIMGLTDVNFALDAIAWAKVSKAGSSLGDLELRSAGDLTSGILALARGGTAADLSATGGASRVLKQLSVGGPVTVAALLAGEMPTGIPAPNISTGIVSNAEFDTLDGIDTSQTIQAQLDKRIRHPRLRKTGWIDFSPSVNAPIPTGMQQVQAAAGTLAAATSGTRGFKRFSTSSVLQLATRTQVADYRSGDDLKLYVDLLTGPSLADVFYFVGFVNNSAFNSDTGSNNDFVGFRFSTRIPDTAWIGMRCNGVTANTTVTGTIAAIATDTRYEMEIDLTGAGTLCTMTINGGTPVSFSTFLPTITTALYMHVGMANLAANAKSFGLGSVFVERN